MSDLARILGAFRKATGCDVAVWIPVEDGLRKLAGAGPGGGPDFKPPASAGPPMLIHTPRGSAMHAMVPGPARRWLTVGPCEDPATRLADFLDFLLPVVSLQLQAVLEVEHAATELAERYEEINLLYTISEILGRSVALPEVASTILHEVCETVGARRGSLLVSDEDNEMLVPLAVQGALASEIPPIPVDDTCSVSARVFREQRAVIVDDTAMWCDAEAPYRRGTMLSVPVMWTAPGGIGEPLGVVNLSDRSSDAFTAGDQKLVAAIATQIATAIQNARLVQASLDQQQLEREMQLAHDLQMKLLPGVDIVRPHAEVAARVVPAESVGGDFYQLFRLGGDRTGVMLGDVSSHGYGAALIMALAMSASAIHAQIAAGPAEMLRALLASLGDELASTEMSISAFYGVIDRKRGEISYANAGMPHVFVMDSKGNMTRLGATVPPLGMGEVMVDESQRAWSGDDQLILFTDGLTDAHASSGERFGESRVLDAIRQNRSRSPAETLEAVFDALSEHIGAERQPDDQTCIIVRS